MSSSFSSSRISALVSLTGAGLIILGFCLPMFIESNPQHPGSAYPVYEWRAVTSFPGSSIWIGCVVAALPLLAMLVVLVASGITLFGATIQRLVLLQRVAAGLGLPLQLLFQIFVFMLYLIGYDHTDIASGLVIMPIGFIVMLIGTWPGALRPRAIFTPVTWVLFAIGSVIMCLGWLNDGSFFQMFFTVLILLSTMFLLGEFGSLIAKQWITAVLVIPLVVLALYGIYFLCAFIIPGVPGVIFITLLGILNITICWLTLQSHKRVERPERSAHGN